MEFDKTLLAFAHRLADEAGKVIRGYWQQSPDVQHKPDDSPVTRADKEAEKAMRTLIESAYPQHGMLGEEFGVHNADADYCWVLDPIDGTRAFIAGQPTFTTLIALHKNNIPLLGIIDQSITGERWAGDGKTTLQNGNTVTVSDCSELATARLGTTSEPYFTNVQAEAFAALGAQCSTLTRNEDAYLYAKLACGALDVVVDNGLKPYDFCALRPIVEGAGGIITDWQGKPLTLHSGGDVIASVSETLHAESLKILSV